MSPQDFGTHLSDLTTKSATGAKAGLSERAKTLFFDSMVMYGWLANRDQEVTCVNDSLLDWMIDKGHLGLASDIQVGKPVGLVRFLSIILRDPDEADDAGAWIGELIQSRVSELIAEVEALNREEAFLSPGYYENPGREDRVGEYFIQKSLHLIEEHRSVLAALRVVKAGAIRMNSPNARDRVDIIIVCQVCPSDAGWQVIGIQGQLQQAWLRVKAVIEAKTHAGTLGLMGRSISHNIGSHALFYLEVDEDNKEKQRFYRYLRERMELLAGFSTVLSLSATTDKLSNVIGIFRNNSALLSRIARSEDVKTVNVVAGGRDDAEVALPAGVLGAQALYTILENNIRDSAKHGRSRDGGRSDLTVNIEVREPEDGALAEDYYEIIVSDDRGNYEEGSKNVNESLARLRIVNELGQLEPGNWGIKERFIAAAILRGIRLEDISVQQSGNREEATTFYLAEFKPKILSVTNVNGNLGWVFYLMKPKEILLVTEGGEGFAGADAVTVKKMDWLIDNIDKPSEVRHKFVVVRARPPDDDTKKGDIARLVELEDKLPHRLFVCPPPGETLRADSHFVPIDEESLEPGRLSTVILYSKWVEWLVKQKKGRLSQHTPMLRRLRAWFSDDEKFVMPEVAFCTDTKVSVISCDDSGAFDWRRMDRGSYKPRRPVILVDRHGTYKQKSRKQHEQVIWKDDIAALGDKVVHYETHVGGDAVRQLASVGEKCAGTPTFSYSFAEAALIKILIVDERLDPVSRRREKGDLYYADDIGDWSCTKNELFHWKGVDIRGGEYGQKTIPGRETLIGWVSDQGYDFLVLHKGIVDKLIKTSAAATPAAGKEAMRELFAELKKHVRQLVIHTGRMSWKDLPEGCKFMALSNVDTWLRNNASKVQIVEDICLLRRV